MASKILVDRNTHGGAMVTFEDRHGFVAVEYLDAAQIEELIGKLRGTWTEQPTRYQQEGGLNLKAEPTVTPLEYPETITTSQHGRPVYVDRITDGDGITRTLSTPIRLL